MMVLFFQNVRGKKARGARVLLLSQKGIATRQVAPMTSMVKRLGSFHPTLAPKVKGIRMRVKATQMRTKPKKSSSNHRVLIICHHDSPANGDSGSMPRMAALR